MNLQDASTQLLFTVVPIWVLKQDNTQTQGTAFIFSVRHPSEENATIPLVVTNHHVVANAKLIRLQFVQAVDGKPDLSARVDVDIEGAAAFTFSNPELDIAAGPIGPMFNQLTAANKAPFFRAVGPELIPPPAALADLSSLEEVVFIGYPAGLRDEKNWLPIIRRGITASPPWNDFEGAPHFLLDAAVFPGSSGSPVFILNQGSYATRDGIAIGSRLFFLGVVTSTLSSGGAAGGSTLLNLGKAVRSDAVGKFLSDNVAQLIARK